MSTPWIVLVAVLWAVVLVLVVLVLGLSRRVERMQQDLTPSGGAAGFPAGPAVGERLPTSDQYRELLRSRETKQPRLLLFMHADCLACRGLADEIDATRGTDGQHVLGGGNVTLVTDEDGATIFDRLGIRQAVVEDYQSFKRALGVPGTPYAVALDAAERVKVARFVPNVARLRDVALEAGFVEASFQPALAVTHVEPMQLEQS